MQEIKTAMPSEDELVNRVLGERHVEKVIKETYYDNLDAVMAEGQQERPWQSFELTQREDVREWIKQPSKIEKIQANLEDFRGVLAPLSKPVRILDVGCYGGYLFDYLERIAFSDVREFEYLGVDIQPDVVAAAARVHEGKSNASFQNGDVYALQSQFGAQSFDVTFCSRVLIHIPYFEKAIGELFAAAKTAAIVVLEIADRPQVQRIHRRNLDNGTELDYFIRKFSEQEILAVAAKHKADCRIIKSSGVYSTVCFKRS